MHTTSRSLLAMHICALLSGCAQTPIVIDARTLAPYLKEAAASSTAPIVQVAVEIREEKTETGKELENQLEGLDHWGRYSISYRKLLLLAVETMNSRPARDYDRAIQAVITEIDFFGRWDRWPNGYAVGTGIRISTDVSCTHDSSVIVSVRSAAASASEEGSEKFLVHEKLLQAMAELSAQNAVKVLEAIYSACAKERSP